MSGKNVTTTCIVFIAILCIVLGFVTHFHYKRFLYGRYEDFISDILHYVDHHIDDDDLLECIQKLKRSEKL